MRGKTIMGLVLAAGLLLIGTFAYAHWSDFGPQGNYGAGYGYGYKAAYSANVNDTAVRNFTSCYRYWQGNGNWYAPDNRHGHGNGWTGYRGYGMTGPRGCWQQ